MPSIVLPTSIAHLAKEVLTKEGERRPSAALG